MNELEVRTLLDEASSGPRPPAAVDIAAAVRRGERIRRGRRAAGTALAAVAVAVAVTVPAVVVRGSDPAGTPRSAPVAGPGGSSTAPAPAVRAPDRFDPLVRRVQIGWLPGTLLDGQWELTATGQQFGGFESGTDRGLLVGVLARGQRFDADEHGLGLPEQPRETPAAPVRGRPATCIGEAHQPRNCTALRWEYAPGAWARVAYAGRLGSTPAATLGVLRRVAESVTLAAGGPVRLPFRVDLAGTGLRPARTLVDIRTTGTGPYGERWSASLDLTTTGALSGYDARRVTIDMLSVPGPIYKDGAVNTRVDGHPASRGHNGDEDSLAVFGVRGSRLLVDVTIPGHDPLALYHAVHPVPSPADPATWTAQPTG